MRQREIRVFDIFPVNFFVDIQQVGIFELFNWLMRYLRNPKVNPEPSVLQYNLLKIVEIIPVVVVCLQTFQ